MARVDLNHLEVALLVQLLGDEAADALSQGAKLSREDGAHERLYAARCEAISSKLAGDHPADLLARGDASDEEIQQATRQHVIPALRCVGQADGVPIYQFAS